MESINRHIKNIIKANENDSLAVFVGAGVSKTSENNYLKLPSWDDLINDMKFDLDISDENDYLKIAQLYYLTYGEFIYYSKLKNYFPENIPPSEIHKLIFELKPHAIITTNWDSILESLALNNIYFYETVSSDKDLMKSRLDKKIIKMHGDFKSHNIVFKEDDYINYKENFPLIENYVKSILSTHTIIFIGYSYNDINLKHIIKWTQSHSNVRPPMYLVTFEDIPSQRKYLENHGITTLVLTKVESKLFPNSEYSNKLYTFLNTIKNENIVSDMEEDEVLDFIYSKICNLKNMNAILADQILKCLSNCGLIYINDEYAKAFLYFYKNEVTKDYNKELRKTYEIFKKTLSSDEKLKQHNKKLKEIFKIFLKSDISGVIIDDKKSEAILTSEILDSIKKIEIEKELYFDYFRYSKNITKRNSLLSYNDGNEPYKFYQFGKYDIAYSLSDEIISTLLKQKDYASLLISLFNQNIIIHRLQYGLDTKKEYNRIEENRIEFLYDSLPANLKKTVSPIYDLITFNYLFKFSYTVDSLLMKYKDKNEKNIIYYIDADDYKADFLLRNLMHFVLSNGCLIDEYIEFKHLILKFIQIKITKQKSEGNITLNRVELFSCIKYLKNDRLSSLFNRHEKSPLKIKINSDDEEWLIKRSLKDIKDGHLSNRFISNPYEHYVINIFILSSLLDLSTENESFIFDQIDLLLDLDRNNIIFFEEIQKFIVFRYNDQRENISKAGVTKIIKKIIKKVSENNIGGYEKIAIINRGLPGIFSVAKNIGIEINDMETIKKLIDTISRYSDEEKIRASETILYDLFLISGECVKELLKNHIRDTPIQNLSEDKKIKFKLFLLATHIENIENESDLPLKTLNLVRKYNNKKFYSEIYKLEGLLNSLVNNCDLNQFKESLEIVNKTLLKYKNTDTSLH